MSSFLAFLDTKPLFYDEIDYDRMPRVWDRIKIHFKLPKIIHIVGTNGKGTTGRFLAWHLYRAGYRVGHYSSPHILKFNERVWKNGDDCSDKELQKAHEYLLEILTKEEIESLSYFEYTTLMAAYLFQDTDFAVMEAGMGGEYDATAVFEQKLSLITPIDLDHEAFLGDTIEEIALTKLKSVKKCAILAKQPNSEVYEVAKSLSKKRGFSYYFYRDLFSEEEYEEYSKKAHKIGFRGFLKDNLLLSLSALKYLNIQINLDLFKDLKLFGRVQKISDNVIIDAGHNVLAAKALKEYLGDKKVVLVYNSYKDKEYKEILNILKPNIKRVEILPISSKRALETRLLKEYLDTISLQNNFFDKIKQDEDYLVFGSFSVVEEFLKGYV